ncbi:MAG: hypothetical protein QOJ63_2686 [Solirubrobacteraceae bacterium]|jgi:hypothetical protein|nr:hypothetical protein [Solirubrobacteraceae bacterium]
MAIQQLPRVQPLHRGGRSEAARALQAATNRRLRARDLATLTVPENGVVDAVTLSAVRRAAWALGARSETYEAITRDGEISVGVQQMIRNPGRRTQEQVSRGKARMSRLRAQRKHHHAAGKSSRSRAVNAFLAKVGTTEHPANSNGGGIITTMETYWGFGKVAWCGIACGYHAAKFGGVKGLKSDVASVSAIESHARNRNSPYGHWQSTPEGALRGSFVVIGRSGMHVGMLVQPLSGGAARTVEGNTSFGPGGSQSDGGCIALRVRSAAEIVGVATMNYPG